MKNRVFYFLILISSLLAFTACKKDDESHQSINIEGIWRVIEFTSNGQDILQQLNIDKMYYEFKGGGELIIFYATTTGDYNLDNGSFTYDQSSNELVVVNSGNTASGEAEYLTDDAFVVSGTDNLGNPFTIEYKRIGFDLCENIDCTNGECYYGFCICESAWEGINCDQPIGSIGSQHAVLIYDKGSYSDGWRFIEALDMSFIQKPWSCGGFAPGDLSWFIGGGKENTQKIVAKCGSNTAAGFAMDYDFMGFDDWYLPSRNELGEICNKKSAFTNFPMGGIWSSSDMKPNAVDPPLPLVIDGRDCTFSPVSETIGYTVYVVRYF